ncbi:hypothetical protein AB3662_38450 [Sorangium cellulosum]|uniref:hypothetical protein n=1 Tax=Sorangium cellulosum TaxID=56 RepID=UPI003D9A83CF
MRAWFNFLSVMAAAGCLGVACTGNIGPVLDLVGGDTGSGGTDSVSGVGSGGGVPPTTADATISTSTATGSVDCSGLPDDDADGDGFSELQGDCDDCNALVNPNAIDPPTVGGDGGADPAPVDDDCNGVPDDYVPEMCDDGLLLDDDDPYNAAKAVELCKMSSGPGDWGVVSAKWVMVDGAPPPEGDELRANFHRGHGLLPGFGPNVTPRGGARLLALSSGAARQQQDEGYESPQGFDKKYESDFPAGFPKHPRECGDLVPAKPSDPTAIEITIRVPSNVHGFSFHVNYATFDWPYACTDFNDYFIALLSPRPPDLIDGHILFDAQNNAMSINNAFIDVCTCEGERPCNIDGVQYDCDRGTLELLGTGFENRAGTSWLLTSAPVEPNQEIKIRWGAYDAGDHELDSTGLVDNWRWLTEEDVRVVTVADRPAL